MADEIIIPDTEIVSLGVDQWTIEEVTGLPVGWSDKASRMPGGKVYATMHGMAANLQTINDYLVYAFDSTRIETATGEALDLIADDYYGINGLPRKVGESDDSYRERIKSGLFQPYATKDAFIQAITALTGKAPRLIEGWRVDQTAAYDWSYYDVDIPERPGLYGDASLIAQGFVIATLPPPTGEEQATAIWGYDAGAGYDLYTGTYWNLKAADFISQFDLDQLILRIKAFGVTIWRKYLYPNILPFPIAVSFSIAPDLEDIPINIEPFNNAYIVIASGNWNSTYAVDGIINEGFDVKVNTPSPSNGVLNYVIIPIAQPEIVQGAGALAVNPGDVTAEIPAPVLPATPGNRVAATPSWATNIWITAINPDSIDVHFSSAAPDGAQLNYFFFPPTQSALYYVTALDITNSSAFISIPNMPKSCPFVTPSWNTEVGVSQDQNGITATFNTPPPPGSFLQWGYYPVTGG